MAERFFLAIALAACTALPSRIALATAQPAGLRLLLTIGGLLADAATVGPAFIVVLELSSGTARRRRLGLGALVILLAVALFAENAAAEFRVQRGVMPGLIDLREGLGHHDFLTAEGLSIVVGRFGWMNLASVVIASVLLGRWLSLDLHASRVSQPRALLAAIAVSAALVLTSHEAEAYGASLHNRDALASPTAVLLRGFIQRGGHDGSPASIRRLLAGHDGHPGEAAEGARNLGLAPDSAALLEHGVAGGAGCAPHPLRRPLEDASEPAIVRATRALSASLFRGCTAQPIVFHVSLESMRADDVHALDPSAPPELAPFLSDVYAGHPSAIAFAHAHQSGVRTSQALAAVMCGIGALPFNLSMSRDLGPVPLRCLPDVLVDARFRAGVFYGHELVFDDMATFLGFHGMSFHERAAFRSDAPRGVWDAVSDAAVYAAALDDAEEPGEGAQYKFILTLSHHSPYTPPGDMAPPLRAEIDELCRARAIHAENCDRLKTLRYSDAALRAFLERVESSKNAARTIVIVSGDHTVHQWVPWKEPETPDGITRIPLFVWVPEAMRRAASDPAALAEATTRLRELARSEPVSNADVPTLVLALLDQSSPLRSLPAEARWHTLGGQATSAYYRSPTGRGVVHGIDAHGGLFDVSEDGLVRPSGIEMQPLRGPDDIARAGLHDAPSVAFLGSFLRDYAARCPAPAR